MRESMRACRTLGPTRWDDFRIMDGSGKDLAPMDLRSMFESSDSTESTTEEAAAPSSARAEWIMTMALTWSQSFKHHPLLLRVSITGSSELEPESSSMG